ncbi:MAG: type IV toxin-antitoxin system AbiEi family antitoxin [Candidatus Omnitrophica bacterium]|nr:type IV toxin-antitoxin system AbiEi family antitoxin [Candidatus Omnitrophota bacterium]
MDRQKSSKINNILKKWPKGSIAVYNWLRAQGVYHQLADTYVKGSWLERVGRGAFKRSGDVVDWRGGLYALQTLLKMSVHAGSKTALELQGRAHYVSVNMKQHSIVLFGGKNEKLPAWFSKHDWKVKIRYVMSGIFGDNKFIGLTDHSAGDYQIKVSSPERAALELCYDVPFKKPFDEVDYIIAGLTTLRPQLIQSLLEKCRSVKTKRVFMYLAEKHKHLWVNKLDLGNVDFGRGKRALCKNGHYDKKYKIVVPKEETNL